MGTTERDAWLAGKADYGAVEVVIALDNLVVRRGLAEALRYSGFAHIAEAGAVEDLRALLQEKSFDVVVTGSELRGKFVGGMVSELRAGRLSHHAFPVVMIYLSQGAPEHVSKVIDGGPDDMLLLPVVPGQLMARLEILAERRKPFIVTHDYIGPDRRKEPRPGAQTVPLLDVPNPLKARLANIAEEALKAEIRAAGQRLGGLKTEAMAVQLRWLEKTLATALVQGMPPAAMLHPHLVRLKRICGELLGRLKSEVDGQPLPNIAELAGAVQAILQGGPTVELLEALPALCGAVADDVRRRLVKAPAASA